MENPLKMEVSSWENHLFIVELPIRNVIFYSYVTVYQRAYQIMYNNNLNHLTYGDDHDENFRRIPRKNKPTSSCLDFRSCVQIQGSWILMINGC